MKPKTLGILAVVALVAVIAAVAALRTDRSAPAPAAGVSAAGAAPAVFGGLAARLNDVASVSVKTGKGESTVELADGQWRLKEKSGYPVEAAKVKDVVLGLAALRNYEARTALPERYKSLGVEDPAPAPAAKKDPPSPGMPPSEAETSQATLVTIKDKAGQALASLIVGNTKWGQKAGDQGVYLRKPGEAQSYYAEGKLEVPRDPLTWLNNEFADIGRDRVWSVTVLPREEPEKNRIVVSRAKPSEGSFAVQGVPEGKQLKDLSLAETVVAGLVKTTFEDVAKVETIDFAGAAGGKPGPTVDVRTWDGLLVHVETAEQNGRTWWKLTAAADPEPFKEAPAAPPAPAPSADGSTPAAPPSDPEPKPRRAAEEVKKEVDDLNARWGPWAFSPYTYKSGAFSRKMGDELKDATPAPVPTAIPPAAGEPHP